MSQSPLISQASPIPVKALEAPKTVTVLSMFVGEQQASFEQALIPFEQATGIDVIYEGTEDFAKQVVERVDDGQSPDIAIFPQPALLTQFAEQGKLVPITDIIEKAQLKRIYSDAWIDLGSVDDTPYALWYRASVKSLVWYRPTAFDTQGYGIPTTWEELMALSEQIVADGGTPWCIGLGSGAATGWPGTDWIEDIMLRTAGPEAYRQWVTHQIPFSSPPVVQSMKKFGQILHRPGFVDGEASSTISKPYGETALALFKDPPNCYLYRQGSFISSFFPDDKAARVDYDIFPLPSIDQRFGTPILVAGDALGMFRDTPEARALMEYFTTLVPHESWAQVGGFISPHKQFDIDQYPDLVTQKIAYILSQAESIQFDGSDMMPGSIGTDTFWTEMVRFAEGKSPEAIAETIDTSWPETN